MKKSGIFAVTVAVIGLALPTAAFADDEGGIGDAAQGNKAAQSGRIVGKGTRHMQNLKKAKQVENMARNQETVGRVEKSTGNTMKWMGSVERNKGLVREGNKATAKGKRFEQAAKTNRETVRVAKNRMVKDTYNRAGVSKKNAPLVKKAPKAAKQTAEE